MVPLSRAHLHILSHPQGRPITASSSVWSPPRGSDSSPPGSQGWRHCLEENPVDPPRAPWRPRRTLEETLAEAPENSLRDKFPRRASRRVLPLGWWPSGALKRRVVEVAVELGMKVPSWPRGLSWGIRQNHPGSPALVFGCKSKDESQKTRFLFSFSEPKNPWKRKEKAHKNVRNPSREKARKRPTAGNIQSQNWKSEMQNVDEFLGNWTQYWYCDDGMSSTKTVEIEECSGRDVWQNACGSKEG